MTFFRPPKRRPTSSQHQPAEPPQQQRSLRTRVLQAIILPIVSVLVFLLILEGALALFGIQPVAETEDPFVGFSANLPLFVPNGEQMVTARNKQNFFNPQSFPRQKPAGTFRVFTLGGSTTYGRPYSDTTSFSGWLRELLPQVDSGRTWEIINAGGISYASYRVAHLMEELVAYQPDLFVVYTGHNEFLEERTYGALKKMPAVISTTVALLSRTRTWSAMTLALQSLGVAPPGMPTERDRLAGEVNTILDQSAGLDRYTRDDPLREQILTHYRISLERITALARSVGAEVLFVTPASNLKDCTPFKSEHTDTLDAGTRKRADQLLAHAEAAIAKADWETALGHLDDAVSLDPRHAGLQYHRGQVLLAMNRFEEAELALRRARDEDVCPLRALTPMRQIVTEVAQEQDTLLVDYVGLLENLMRHRQGQPIPGREFFLDHVHPTIEGHQLLAEQIIKVMATVGMVQPVQGWQDTAVPAAKDQIDAQIDEGAHALALVNLARVLLWAGKTEEATRLAEQAGQIANAPDQVQISATSILTSILLEHDQPEAALHRLYATLAALPGALEIHMKLGEILKDDTIREMEKAAGHLLLVCQQMPGHDDALTLYGRVMAQRGRLGIAYDSTAAALQINPKNAAAQDIQTKIRTLLKGRPIEAAPFEIDLQIYPSRAPRQLTQKRRMPGGRLVPHGIQVEFYENGRLKSFQDLAGGKLHGLVKTWDEQGRELSRQLYRQGQPVEE